MNCTTKEQLEFFVKYTQIPILLDDIESFDKYKLLDKYYDVVDKYNTFKKSLNNSYSKTFQNYKNTVEIFRDQLINIFRPGGNKYSNVIKFDIDVNKNETLLQNSILETKINNLYNENNINKIFLSISLKEPDFNIIKSYDKTIFDNKETWFEYMMSLCNDSFLASSPYFQYSIFNSVNKFKKTKELYVFELDKILTTIKNNYNYTDLDIVYIDSVEIVLIYKGISTELNDEFKNIYDINIFMLKRPNDTFNYFIKKNIYNNNNNKCKETIANVPTEFICNFIENINCNNYNNINNVLNEKYVNFFMKYAHIYFPSKEINNLDEFVQLYDKYYNTIEKYNTFKKHVAIQDIDDVIQIYKTRFNYETQCENTKTLVYEFNNEYLKDELERNKLFYSNLMYVRKGFNNITLLNFANYYKFYFIEFVDLEFTILNNFNSKLLNSILLTHDEFVLSSSDYFKRRLLEKLNVVTKLSKIKKLYFAKLISIVNDYRDLFHKLCIEDNGLVICGDVMLNDNPSFIEIIINYFRTLNIIVKCTKINIYKPLKHKNYILINGLSKPMIKCVSKKRIYKAIKYFNDNFVDYEKHKSKSRSIIKNDKINQEIHRLEDNNKPNGFLLFLTIGISIAMISIANEYIKNYVN